MLNTFLLTNRMKESLGGGFYRLLERREVVNVTARMMDFGKQNGNFLSMSVRDSAEDTLSLTIKCFKTLENHHPLGKTTQSWVHLLSAECE